MRGIIDIDNHPRNIDLERDLMTGTFDNRCKRLKVTPRITDDKLNYDEYDPNIYDVVFNHEIDLKVLIM